MKHTVIFCLALMLLLSMATDTLAIIGIGPRLGYYRVKEADDGRYFGGAAARFNLLGLGVEGAIDYRAEKYHDGLVTAKSWPVTVSLLYYPLPIIYGVAGFGWYHTTIDYNQAKLGAAVKDQTSSETGYHIGAGVQLPIGLSTKIAADIRYVFLNYKFDNFPGDGKTKANFYAITVGIFWNLL